MREFKIIQRITGRDGISLERYFKEVDKYPLLTPEEEVSLVQEYKQGDENALEKLVTSNLRFVISVAKQYQNSGQNHGFTLNDLIDEGNIGLIRAAQRFDETRGFKFISYAVWWIRQSILKALNEDSRLVRLPSNKVGDIRKIEKMFDNLEQEYGREPSDGEIIEELKANKNYPIHELMALRKWPSSLDSPISDGEGKEVTLADKTQDNSFPNPDKKLVYDKSLDEELNRILKQALTEKEQIVIRGHILESRSLESVGEELKYTKENIRLIKNRAIKKLRKPEYLKILKEYL